MRGADVGAIATPGVALSRAERAFGTTLGLDAGTAPLDGDSDVSPAAAMLAAVAPAVHRPPCVVSFSGGRDSSAVLAAAVHVARRDGAPLPIPVTLTFPGVAETDEDSWQDHVLEHLGLGERERIVVGGELDIVGPVARAVMARHGLLMPSNLYCHEPMLERAAGGSLLTGIGGDELALSSIGLHVERLMVRGPRTTAERVRVLGRRAPGPVRFLHHLRAGASALQYAPWLTTRGRLTVRAALAAGSVAEPLGWPSLLRQGLWRTRGLRVGLANLDAMAQHHDVAAYHPFVDAGLLRSLADSSPWEGLGGRARMLRAVTGDLLDDKILARESKASFSGALWTSESQEFGKSWEGTGLDEAFVDPTRARAQWLDPDHDALSAFLLQTAWSASG